MGNKKLKNKINKENKHKNNLVKHLLIIWFTFLFLCFVIFLNSNLKNNSLDLEKFESASGNIELWSFSKINIENLNESIENVNKNKNIKNLNNEYYLNNKAKETILDFYSSINKADFKWYYLLFDKILKSDNNMQIYFSQARIDRFINKINWGVKVNNINELLEYYKQSNYFIRKWFSYTLKYNVDWIDYFEDWEMVLLSYNWWEKFYINYLYCKTENCWKSPFYN